MRRALTTAVAVAALVGGAGARGGTAVAGDASVTIVGVNQGYSPSSVKVGPGDTVTWTDRDPTPAPHNAICDDSCPEPFSSGDPGATGTTGHYTFRYSGTYNYKCAVHPNMKGTVVVTGNVHPPAAAADAGPSSAPGAATATANPGPSATATANSGGSATATASSPSTPSTPSGSASASDTAGAAEGKVPLPPVGQLALPEPQVRIRQASSRGTPWWVLLPSALVLLVATGACALAWLGPRPLRREEEAAA